MEMEPYRVTMAEKEEMEPYTDNTNMETALTLFPI